MSDKQFFNNLGATYADVRRLDAKKINLKGKNILDYIEENKTIILEYIEENKTIILDERGTNADDELDVWNSYITKDENGNVIIDRNAKPKEHSVVETNDDANTWMVYEGITESQVNTLKTAIKVIDNEVLDANDEHIMYWQTDGLTKGHRIFCNTELKSFSSNLSSLTSGFRMFEGCDNLTTFNADLSSLTDGDWIFSGCKNLTSFNSDLPSLTSGHETFNGCTNLTTFNSDLSNLVFCYNMFEGCDNLTTFNADLSSLTSGGYMFADCSNLTSFNGDLSSLTDGGSMFYNTNLKSFSSDLPSLTNGYSMFSGCSDLKSFNYVLTNLTDSRYMFSGCTSLTSFTSDLSSLTKGNGMFNNCKLDSLSVANIILSLPQRDDEPSTLGTITIGINIYDAEDIKDVFAKELFYESWAELNQDFVDRKWRVEWQFNGGATTFGLRSPRPSTAVYAKLEEVIMPTDENECKPYYTYTSVDGTKFYNIHWYHESNIEDESYTLFDSLEAAIESYNVILKS